MQSASSSTTFACKQADCSYCGGTCDPVSGCICPTTHCESTSIGSCTWLLDHSQTCQCLGGQACGKADVVAAKCKNATTTMRPLVVLSTPPVQGILRSLSPEALKQCSVCHEVSYGFSTKPAHVEYCKTFGNFIVLAAKFHTSSTFGLAAGLYTKDLETTSSSKVAAGPFNGAYWHYYPAKSIGFTSSEDIDLFPIDYSSKNCENRLSWEFEANYAGGRVGCSTTVADPGWRKMMYICNVSASSSVSALPTLHAHARKMMYTCNVSASSVSALPTLHAHARKMMYLCGVECPSDPSCSHTQNGLSSALSTLYAHTHKMMYICNVSASSSVSALPTLHALTHRTA